MTMEPCLASAGPCMPRLGPGYWDWVLAPCATSMHRDEIPRMKIKPRTLYCSCPALYIGISPVLPCAQDLAEQATYARGRIWSVGLGVEHPWSREATTKFQSSEQFITTYQDGLLMISRQDIEAGSKCW